MRKVFKFILFAYVFVITMTCSLIVSSHERVLISTTSDDCQVIVTYVTSTDTEPEYKQKPTTFPRYIISDYVYPKYDVDGPINEMYPFIKGDKVAFMGVHENTEYAYIWLGDNRYVIERKYLSREDPASIDVKSTKSVNPPKKHGKMIYVGQFQLTAYAWTGNRCANGKYPTVKHTVATHKHDFPMGTKLYIEGYGYYVVEDRGGFKQGVIDIYMHDHNTCVQFGRKHGAKVYVVLD